MAERTEFKIEGCSFSYTYTITVLDGRIVHDEQTAALFNMGYQIVPVVRGASGEHLQEGKDG